MLSNQRLRLSLVVRDWILDEAPRSLHAAFGAARAAQLRVAARREKRDGALHFDVGIALRFGNATARKP